MAKALIAVVDDEEAVRSATGRFLQSLGYDVELSPSAEDFMRSARLYQMSCVILDVHMPHMGGLELQAHMAAAGHHTPIIFVTADQNAITREQALRAGAVDYLDKPFNDEALLEAIRVALKLGNKGRES